MGEIDTSTAAVERLMDGVTPGPWEWGGYPDNIKLQTVHHGKLYVMDFVRKGFSGAQPRFQPKGSGGMTKADELLQFCVVDRSIVGEKSARADGNVYRMDVRGIDHPDARFIAASRELVPALAAERDEADRRAGAAEREMADLRDTISKRSHWLRGAKAEAGYHDNVSFDTVWAETLGMARAADTLRAENERLRATPPEVTALVAAATDLRDQIARWHDGAPPAGPDESKALFEALDEAITAWEAANG